MDNWQPPSSRAWNTRLPIYNPPSDTSPIAKLPHEILMRIFRINANMKDDDRQVFRRHINHRFLGPKDPRAIDRTRISSQVSFLWRDLILKAPSLWANLIDIQSLSGAGREEWREEVLRRTQSAPLYVNGTIIFRIWTLKDEPWFHFFRRNWERIRIFDVILHDRARISGSSGHPNDIEALQTALSFITRSTPTLESFCLKLQFPCNPIDVGASLFDNNAPRLKSFNISSWEGSNHWVGYPTNQQYTWLSQIKNLRMLDCSGTNIAVMASVDVLYQILADLPRLQTLYLNNVIADPFIAPHKRPINLPLLNRIQVRSTNEISRNNVYLPPLCWHILDFIVPKPGCSILVHITRLRSEDVAHSIATLTQYATNFFKFHRPTNLALSSSPNQLSMCTKLFQPTFKALRPMNGFPFLDFCLNLKASASPDATLYQVFQGLFPFSFPHVTNLSLDVALAHRDAFSDTRFAHMLSSFSSAKKVATTVPTLHFLMTSPMIDAKTVFPELKDLIVPHRYESLEEMSVLRISHEETCIAFLDMRKGVNLGWP